MNFRSILSYLFIVLLGSQMHVYSQDVIDPSTLDYKVMAGYQGWFATEGDGSGSGVYNTNEEIIITANAAPDGMEFDSWLVVSGYVNIANSDSASTILTITSTDAYVSAIYKEIGSGIDDIGVTESSLRIYPNPSNGFFHLEIRDNNRLTNYEIFNTVGRLMQTGYIDGPTTSLDLHDYSKGTYIIKLTTEATVYKKLLIIK